MYDHDNSFTGGSMDAPKSVASRTATVPATLTHTAVQVQRSSALATSSPSPVVDSSAAAAGFDEVLGPDVQRLSNAQVIALRVLLTGQGDAAAARAAGKNPKTIGRWKRRHPVFRRCLSAWRDSQR